MRGALLLLFVGGGEERVWVRAAVFHSAIYFFFVSIFFCCRKGSLGSCWISLRNLDLCSGFEDLNFEFSAVVK